MAKSEVSARTEAEELTLRSILESMQDVFYRVDGQGRFSFITRSGALELGWEHHDQLLGRPAIEFWAEPARRPGFLEALERDGQLRDFEVDLLRRDGARITVATTVRLRRGPDGAPLGYEGIWRNVGERKAAERRLRQSEEKFSKIFLTVPDTLVITRARDGLLLDVNPGFETATGWTREAAVGTSTLGLGLWADPVARDQMVADLKAHGEVLYREFTFRRRDGGVREGLYSARTVAIGEEPCVLFIMQDVTERRRLERERDRLEAQLRQAQKLEAVGQVAGGVAHDFNNLLTVQVGCLSLLEELPGLPEEARELLAEIGKSASAAAALTRQLLAFGRRQVLRRQRVDLDQVLQRFAPMLRRVLREDVTVTLDRAPAPCWLDADVGMLEQVVMNLAVNARDAMPGGGRLEIRCAPVEISALGAAGQAEAHAGPHVRLTVADTGHGMDEATQRRIFEPFFTTKPQGQGSGLGLSTVYGIARQHGGWVEVESRPGEGAAFHVLLPAAGAPASAVPSLPFAAPPPAQGETILLVEDDPAVRRTLQATLVRLGYQVLVAPDGAAALEAWRGRAAPIDVVLTDVVMPGGLSGLDLVRRLRDEAPALAAVVMSGYSADLAAGGLPEGTSFLPKPCRPEALAHAIRAALRPRPTARPGG